MSAKFVVSHLDQQLGPFDEAELKAKWGKGELLPIDYVYDEAKQDWILMAERFDWAGGRPEGAPPPIRPEQNKKKRPPEPPPAVKDHITISGITHVGAINPIETSAVTLVKSDSAISLPASTPPEKPQPAANAAPISGKAPIEIKGQSLVKEWKKPGYGGHGAKVKLVDGVGEIDLSPVQPGQVELVLQDSSGTMLKLQEPLRIQVKAAEPTEVVWTVASQANVGNDTEIALKAVDATGATCSHYDDAFIIRINGAQDMHVNMRGGVGVAKLNHTKAESWKITLHYTGVRQLRLPEGRTFDWLPGPAVKLILDGPQNLVAGSPLKVHVKAVDQYGNLAKTFQGTVILEVKAS